MSDKKLLEKGPSLGIAVPIAIVLVGALIIFGVTRMLSTDRSYQDLVRELESKTFGNRWIAAFELSKVISRGEVELEDKDWLVKKLKGIYLTAKDPRTKEFIVVALGAMKDKRAQEIFLNELDQGSKEGKFHALVALSKLGPQDTDKKNLLQNPNEKDDSNKFDPSIWDKLYETLSSSDAGLVHATIFTLASLDAPNMVQKLEPFLDNPNQNLRFAAACALLAKRHPKALELANQAMDLSLSNQTYNQEKTLALKMNFLNAAAKSKWQKVIPLVEKAAKKNNHVKLSVRANQVLKELNY